MNGQSLNIIYSPVRSHNSHWMPLAVVSGALEVESVFWLPDALTSYTSSTCRARD